MVEFDDLAQEHEIAVLMNRLHDLEAQAVIDRVDIDNLHVALDTARRIGAAVGVLIATLKVTETEAFQVLRHASQTSNRKLRDIADDVVETGAVPH